MMPSLDWVEGRADAPGGPRLACRTLPA